MQKIIPYNYKLVIYARKLRKNSTLSEVLLWNRLKGGQINGYKFSRQIPIYKYILDFYCKKLKLAIEVDGESHFGKMEYDNKRIKDLENMGIKILRFGDIQVKTNLDGVVEEIKDWVDSHVR